MSPLPSSLALLVLSLPTHNTTARMRAWRALKSCGAAVLRDGAYALPDSHEHRSLLRTVADDVQAHDGTARLLSAQMLDEPVEPLFSRADDFGAVLREAQQAQPESMAPAVATRQVRKLRKALDQLVTIDFFPGEAQRQAAEAVAALEARVARLHTPDEPHPAAAPPRGLERLNVADFQGRLWATRTRPWVDRLACAWLIRRHIDPAAQFLWLADVSRCPKSAIGFDFDDARFTHVGARVTFETLLAAFGLETPALRRLGTVVHALDAGGVMPAEASGVESVLAGMREAIADDDALMLAAAGVFEGLHQSFEREQAARTS